jgi:hypothetical protein
MEARLLRKSDTVSPVEVGGGGPADADDLMMTGGPDVEVDAVIVAGRRTLTMNAAEPVDPDHI